MSLDAEGYGFPEHERTLARLMDDTNDENRRFVDDVEDRVWKFAKQGSPELLVYGWLHLRVIEDIRINTLKFHVMIDRDEDGVWVVECPAIPGCVSQGRTEDEALDNIREAIAGCLEVRAANGLPLTISVREVEVSV